MNTNFLRDIVALLKKITNPFTQSAPNKNNIQIVFIRKLYFKAKSGMLSKEMKVWKMY